MAKARREHHWDAIRALLMLLGIPYHAALAYRAGREWIVHSGEGAPAFTYLAEFIHLFRMPAFFVVAGYFAALLLTRRAPRDWLRTRFVRLGVPFLACLFTLVPLLNLACELSNLPFHDALSSWRHNAASSGGYWVRHLWFIIVLLYCSSAAALIATLSPRLRFAILPEALDAAVTRRFLPVLVGTAITVGLWEAAAIELFYKAGLATNVPQQILRLDELIAYAPFFAIGCLIARAPLTLARLCRFSPAVAALSALSIGASLIFLDDLAPWAGRFVATIAAIATTQLLVAAAKAVADRPHPLVDRLVPASFVIYLVHMPIIILLVNAGQYLALPVAWKASGVILLAAALSWGVWRLVERSPVLAFLFNGTTAPRARLA